MNIDTILAWAQGAGGFLPAPWGNRIPSVIGLYRANRARIERDDAVLIAFLNDLLPVIQKHWPAVGPAINSELPIIREALKEWQA